MRLFNLKRLKHPGAIIGLSITIFALVSIYITFFTTLLLSPKQKVFLSFAKAFGADSMIASITGFENVKGAGNISPFPHADYTEVRDAIMSLDGDISTRCEFNLDTLNISSFNIPDMIGGVEYHINSQLSPKDQLFHSEMYFKYMSLKAGCIDIYADKNNMYLGADEIPDGVIAVNTSTLGADLVTSPILADLDLSDESKNRLRRLSFDVFNNYDKANQTALSLAALNDKYGEFFILTSNFLNSIRVIDDHQSVMMTIGEKQVRCHQYSVIVNGQSLADYISGSASYFQNHMDIPKEAIGWLNNYLATADTNRDYCFTAILDNKCRLIELSFEDSFNKDGSAPLYINGNITWSGSEYLCDNYNGQLYIEHGTEYLDFSISGNGNRSKISCQDTVTIGLDSNYLRSDLELICDMENDYELDTFSYNVSVSDKIIDEDYMLSLEGATSTDLPIIIDLSQISYTNHDKETSISGSVYIEIETCDNNIPVPDGEKYYIFSMSENELNTLLSNIKENAGTFSLLRILL